MSEFDDTLPISPQILNVLALLGIPAEGDRRETPGPLMFELLATNYHGRMNDAFEPVDLLYEFSVHPRHLSELREFWLTYRQCRVAFLMNNSFGRFTGLAKHLDLPDHRPPSLAVYVVEWEQ